MATAKDFTKQVNRLKNYNHTFTLSPVQLLKFTTAATLIWQKVEFTKDNKALIPEDRGIYAFIIESKSFGLPPHGYVMYVGITGDTGNHNLRKRYGDYLGYKSNDERRPAINYMLNNWEDCLFFHYAVVSNKRFRLSKLEMDMSDALLPPYSTNDFSADIRRKRTAF